MIVLEIIFGIIAFISLYSFIIENVIYHKRINKK
jgi:hypothetical protein